MTPLFPRSGPGESGSPMSAVILRCYDFPARIPGPLFVSLPGSTPPPQFVSRSLRSRSRKFGGCLPGRGRCSTGDPIAGLLSCGRERDLSGSQAIHPVPLPRSRTPAESTIPRLLSVSSMLPLLPSQQRLQRNGNFGATARLQHLLPTLQEVMLPPPLQSSLRAGWLAFSGRELNPLHRYKRFQIKFSFSSSGFILTQEGPSFISRTVAHPRYSWRCS